MPLGRLKGVFAVVHRELRESQTNLPPRGANTSIRYPTEGEIMDSELPIWMLRPISSELAIPAR
jgi:hypothetical protein